MKIKTPKIWQAATPDDKQRKALEQRSSLPQNQDRKASANKLTIKRDLPIRLEALSVEKHLLTAHRYWRIAFVSLPIDFLFLSFPTTAEEPWSGELALDLLLPIAVVALLITVFPVLEHLRKLLVSTQTQIAKSSSALGWIVIPFIALLLLGDMIVRIGASGLIPIFIAVIIAVRATLEARKTFAERQATLKRLQHDRTEWVMQADQQIFLMAIAPILLARSIPFTAGLATALGALNSIWFPPFWAVGAVMLLAHAPRREDFIVPCPRCASWTSRALVHLKICPNCDRAAFWSSQAPDQKKNT